MKTVSCSGILPALVPRPNAGHLEWVCPELLGYDTTVSALVLEDSSHPMHKWRLALTSICDCGVLDQTVSHLILEYPLHRDPGGYHKLLVLDDETRY